MKHVVHAIDERLAKLDLELPTVPSPAANYLPYIVSGNQLWIAGQAAVVDGKHPFVGRLGAAGKHVRTVMGASSLRSRTALVIDAVCECNRHANTCF